MIARRPERVIEIAVKGMLPKGPLGRAMFRKLKVYSAVFEMPLSQALHLGRYHPLDIYRRGDSHRVWLSWYEQYFVWGMTAGIIRELALQIGVNP